MPYKIKQLGEKFVSIDIFVADPSKAIKIKKINNKRTKRTREVSNPPPSHSSLLRCCNGAIFYPLSVQLIILGKRS